MLINNECLETLAKNNNLLRFGIRNAKVKTFLPANPPDGIDLDTVDAAEELLGGLKIQNKNGPNEDSAD